MLSFYSRTMPTDTRNPSDAERRAASDPAWGDLFENLRRVDEARGLAAAQKLAACGRLSFLHSPSSTMIHGVGRDARRVVQAIGARVRARIAA
jgi:hypothetical protein